MEGQVCFFCCFYWFEKI